MIIMIITLFQDGKIAAANARVRAFLEFHLLEHSARYAFQATGCTIIKTMFSGQREMNPVTMTITNLRKKKAKERDRQRDVLFLSPVHYQPRSAVALLRELC